MTSAAVYHGDALELTAEDFGGVDVMIVDPPYGDHVHANTVSNGTAGAGVVPRDLGFASLSDELLAVLALGGANVRRWSIVFSDFESTGRIREAFVSAGAEYIRAVPWVRWSQPQLSGDRPPSGAEVVQIFHRMGKRPIKKRWNGPGSLTHFSRRCLRGRDKHRAEKPLDLALDLVSYFSDPGETVLDPCAGAGTVPLAARLLGREGVGLELDPGWAAKAQRRAVGALSPRDQARAAEWAESVQDEAMGVPEPRAEDGSDVRTYERAQRRLADARKVLTRGPVGE